VERLLSSGPRRCGAWSMNDGRGTSAMRYLRLGAARYNQRQRVVSNPNKEGHIGMSVLEVVFLVIAAYCLGTVEKKIFGRIRGGDISSSENCIGTTDRTSETRYTQYRRLYPYLSDLLSCLEQYPESQTAWAQKWGVPMSDHINQWISEGRPQIEWPDDNQGKDVR